MSSAWLVLLRFGAVLEGRFGFTREIPVLYTPYADLQIRSTDTLEDHLGTLPHDRRSVTAAESFVWAPDARLEIKLNQWSRPTRVLMPLPSIAAAENPSTMTDFINLLAQSLASRDLYSTRGFVTGDDFFGRRAELQHIRDCVRRREVPGIFGLRKTGKTSLVRELIRSADLDFGEDGRKEVYVYQDLEYLPSVAEDPVPELLGDIAEQVRQRLKAAGLRTQEVAELGPNPSPSQFRRALDALLSKLDREATLVIVLDEIEFLCSSAPLADTSGEAYQRVRQLFGSMRKLVQERDNFGFVIAGLASAAIEAPNLFGAPNPLFSFAKPLYLQPFSVDEATEMLNSVGKRVSLYWSEKAIEIAYEQSGGHALLIREIASQVLGNQKHARVNIAHVKGANVHAVIPSWRQAMASHLRDVLPHLRRYYDEEADLAVLLIEEPESFDEYAESYPDNVFRLLRLGIIRKDEDEWQPSRLLELSYGFETRKPPVAPYQSLHPHQGVATETLCTLSESEVLEFKESLRSHSEIPDDVIVDEVLRGCLGFLNRGGGTVLVGVTDSSEVVGVGRDIAKCGDVDRLVLFLTSRIREKIGVVGVDLISVTLDHIDDRALLRVAVSAAPRAVYPSKPVKGQTGLFVRNNASTHLLSDGDALDYARRQWP